MHVWLVHPGELLPCDGKVRLYRYGILAEMLAQRGHTVTRWAPTFVHSSKTLRADHDTTFRVNDRYRIELLHAGTYRRHFGLRRHLFHQRLARKFASRIRQEAKPDVIVCGVPTPELCHESAMYGKSANVPVVLDVRDLWPDAFLDHIPKATRWAVRLLFAPMIAHNRHAFQNATAVTGISPGFRDWGLRYAQREATSRDAVFYMGSRRMQHTAAELKEARRRWDGRGVTANGAFRCCFFAVIGSLYDLEIVVRAARQLWHSGDRNSQFVLCGEGPSVGRLRKLAHDLPNVLLPGWVSPAEVDTLLEMSDLALIPYKPGMHTSLPNKAISYFSAGLPVLSTKGGELATLLTQHDCGELYQAGDVKDFLDVYTSLRGDPIRRHALGRNSRSFYDAELESDNVYGRMITYLEDLANDRQLQRAA